MKIRVQYTAQLRAAIGTNAAELELPPGSTLLALLGHLARLHDEAAGHLLTSRGEIHASLLLVVNGSAISASDAASVFLAAEDVVMLLPPIAGG